MTLNIWGMTQEELQTVLTPFRIPSFRAKQILHAMYQEHRTDFNEMTNLPKGLRAQLSETLAIERPSVLALRKSADGKTAKFLFEFSDGATVESVLMRQPYGNSICVSTQDGCNMGCAFCASTLHGLSRNLTRGEILAEAYAIDEFLQEQGEKIDTCVLIGTGEPLMNYENVVGFLRLMHEKETFGMSYRSFTLSTSGIVPGILRLAEEGLPISLSISLHAPSQELREKIMPIARKYALSDVIAAAKFYAEKTGRRVTYEYILIDGVNDRLEEARELVRLVSGQLANVNLIPLNPVVESGLKRPSQESIQAFSAYLSKHHIPVTVRKEMGTDINAACGQLRNAYREAR